MSIVAKLIREQRLENEATRRKQIEEKIGSLLADHPDPAACLRTLAEQLKICGKCWSSYCGGWCDYDSYA